MKAKFERDPNRGLILTLVPDGEAESMLLDIFLDQLINPELRLRLISSSSIGGVLTKVELGTLPDRSRIRLHEINKIAKEKGYADVLERLDLERLDGHKYQRPSKGNDS